MVSRNCYLGGVVHGGQDDRAWFPGECFVDICLANACKHWYWLVLLLYCISRRMCSLVVIQYQGFGYDGPVQPYHPPLTTFTPVCFNLAYVESMVSMYYVQQGDKLLPLIWR
jgi:hypothetical protein